MDNQKNIASRAIRHLPTCQVTSLGTKPNCSVFFFILFHGSALVTLLTNFYFTPDVALFFMLPSGCPVAEIAPKRF
jgi:hypothetical protein